MVELVPVSRDWQPILDDSETNLTPFVEEIFHRVAVIRRNHETLTYTFLVKNPLNQQAIDQTTKT